MTSTPLRVLFIYPNTPLLNPPPVSVGIFNALLTREGCEVRLFDTTFYAAETSSDKAKEESLQVRPFEFDPSVLPECGPDPAQDLRRMVADFRPDLICTSVLESTWLQADTLLRAIEDLTDAPVLVGGIFATFAPRMILANPMVDMVCIGEGETALVELCRRLAQGRDWRDVPNLVVRDGEDVAENPLAAPLSLDDLPVPDYSIFHPARFLRPMAGRVYRTIPLETNRGCPYKCAFCNSPSMFALYRRHGHASFFRKKSLAAIRRELEALVEAWDPEYVYFPSDTFLVMSPEEFDEFIETYSRFRLPFWIQSRAETITRYRAEKLKEVGCHRISIGLEQGNEEFRRNRLQKKYHNRQIIEAATILHEAGIPLSVNNILGFPDETRELVFDTIELNRQIPFDTTNAYAFTPFHGTPLHDYCVERGWVDPEVVFGCLTIDAPLDMPQLSREEIRRLRKTFSLYARLPRELWPEIERAERDDEEGRRAFRRLRELYISKYF